MIESFNSSFKREELYRHDYLSVRAFKEKIAEYIKYYNESRLHESLNYETPAAFEEKFLKYD
jgi:putative transposase